MPPDPPPSVVRNLTHPTIFLSTARFLLDIPLIHRHLSTKAPWSLGIPLSTVTDALSNSLCIGVYDSPLSAHGTTGQIPQQIGFSRWVTDYSTFGYLTDCFVISEYEHQGVETWMMQEAVELKELEGLRQLLLMTKLPLAESFVKYNEKRGEDAVVGIGTMVTRWRRDGELAGKDDGGSGFRSDQENEGSPSPKGEDVKGCSAIAQVAILEITRDIQKLYGSPKLGGLIPENPESPYVEMKGYLTPQTDCDSPFPGNQDCSTEV